MHIGLVIYGSLDQLSGGYLYDRRMVEYMRGEGDIVEIVSLPSRSYVGNLRDNFDSALFRRLTDTRFDVLVQDELNHPSLFQLNHRLQRQVSYPIVAIVHHLKSSEQRPAWQNAIYEMIERRYLSSVNGFIFNSATTKGVIEKLVGSQRPSLIAYPGGDRLGVTLNTEQIRARAYEPGPLRIFFLGNIIPRKGLHTLLDALARLPHRSWTLTTAGSLNADRDYAASIQSQIERLHIADQVSLPGPLSGETLIEQLKQHHVLAMPSSYEGFGIAYVEGMAFGLPSIGTTHGAARELISHGENGFLIEPENSGHLAEYLESLVVNRQRLAEMSLAARQRFDKCPTWDQSAAAVHEFLRSITGLPNISE